MGECYVYILRCSDGSLYTGWTTDPGARAAVHNRGKGGKYTRSRLPVTLVYVEPQPGRGAALSRERAIKKMTRQEKLRLIAGAGAPAGM